MKMNRILALLGISLLMVIVVITSCKKDMSGAENNGTATPQTPGLKQQGNSPAINGKGGGSTISQYFVNHTPNIITDDNDPHPVDCVVEGYTDYYALKVDCNGETRYIIWIL